MRPAKADPMGGGPGPARNLTPSGIEPTDHQTSPGGVHVLPDASFNELCQRERPAQPRCEGG
jgi:hypothetical protein